MPLSRTAPRRLAFTLAELLVVVAGVAILIVLLVQLFSFAQRSTQRVSSQLAVQQAGRKAVVRFLRELAESMEVLAPTPGGTISYALVRDRVALVRWFYQVPQRGKPDSFELWRYVHDPSLPEAQRAELLLSGVKRLTFTSRSEGALLVNLVLADDGRETAILTTVRLRNLASTEELW